MQGWRDDPLCQAVERAYRAGIVVVASAGNHGKTADGRPIYGGITTPGISPFAITVGALNTKGTPWRSDDEVASYSSKGPTLLRPPHQAGPRRTRQQDSEAWLRQVQRSFRSTRSWSSAPDATRGCNCRERAWRQR